MAPQPKPPPPRRPTGSLPSAPKPADLGTLARQIVAEQKEQRVQMREAMHKKPRKPIAPVLAGLLVLGNVAAWMIFPPRTDTTGDARNPGEIERDVRLVVASAASEVEIWRLNHGGTLPASFADAGIRPDSGVTFVLLDSLTFEVRGAGPGVAVTYNSNTRLMDFMNAGPAGGR